MISNLKADRPTIVVGLSLLCPVILVIIAIGDFWLLRQQYASEIDNISPRTARLLGFIQTEDQLDTAVARINGGLDAVAYPGDIDSDMTAAAMQQKIREVMTNTGLSVSGSQILPPKEIEGFERLLLNITVEGNIDALDEAISDLRLLRPLVLIEAVNIKPARHSRARRGDEPPPQTEDQRKLSVRFNLLSLKLLP